MRIAIDPGHGMANRSPNVFDPGATRRVGTETFAEADIVLRYGHTLRRMLEEDGHEVFMTRTSSADSAPIGGRATRARNAGARQFISLHLNAATNPQGRGVEVLFRDPVKDKPLADRLQAELVQATGFNNRGTIRRTDLAVLRFQPGPAVLIELGFITNDGDRTFLLNGDNRDRICRAILQVVTS